ELDLGQMAVAGHPPDFRVEKHFDIGGLFDAPREIARHVLVEIVATDYEVHLANLGGEKDDGLAGGIAATDDDHVRSRTHLRFDGSCSVVDPAAFELRAAFDVEDAVVGSGGDQQALARDRLAAFDVHHRVNVCEVQAGNGWGYGQARAEFVGLHDGALRQLAAGDAGGETE